MLGDLLGGGHKIIIINNSNLPMKIKLGNTAYFATLAWHMLPKFTPFPSVYGSKHCAAAEFVNVECYISLSLQAEGNCLIDAGMYLPSFIFIIKLLHDL
jgi:hypothetical protein